jgi:hypothetical protein
VHEYCAVQCTQLECSEEHCPLSDGTEGVPSCNCKTVTSDIPTYFTAPAAGNHADSQIPDTDGEGS